MFTRKDPQQQIHIGTPSHTAIHFMNEDANLAAAREMIDHGIPVFTAPPGRGGDGPEFYFPKGWTSFTPDPEALTLWRPGYALLAASGHGLDVIDIDPKNGASVTEQTALATSMGIPILGVVQTPSMGAHLYIPSCGLGNAACHGAGVDYRGRTPEGTGAGMTFLPGTERPHYDGAGYMWHRPIAWEQLQQWTAHQDEVRGRVQQYLATLGWRKPAPRAPFVPSTMTRVHIQAPPSALVEKLEDLGPEWAHEDGSKHSDRSSRFNELVQRCRSYGLTYAETLSLMEPWCHAMDKFTNRVEREVHRSWSRRQWED
jgi:hypothetical protein